MKKMFLSALLLISMAGAGKVAAQQDIPGGPCGYWGEGAMGASSIYCSNYFICGPDLIWHRYVCPPGLDYNENTETCDWPDLIVHYCGCYED
ncbi:carbohydrate-binding module family 14 protein [Pedobacter sp. GR22-6]|uniref:carbohydrate-binding module family 14 protein n=1 Tax=Pedobacter sp. GR22-6 TaxID=3127957 RepID=UPI00307D3954